MPVARSMPHTKKRPRSKYALKVVQHLVTGLKTDNLGKMAGMGRQNQLRFAFWP